MRIGLFYQIQVPKPWTPQSEAQRIYEALEQIPYAEAQGLGQRLVFRAPFPPGMVAQQRSRPDLGGGEPAHGLIRAADCLDQQDEVDLWEFDNTPTHIGDTRQDRNCKNTRCRDQELRAKGSSRTSIDCRRRQEVPKLATHCGQSSRDPRRATYC